MKKVNVNPKGLCPRCNIEWNIHDCPSISHYEVGECAPVGNGHPCFDELLEIIAIKYRIPIETHDPATEEEMNSNAMSVAYNEALGDVVRICAMNWNKHPEIIRLKKISAENDSWVKSWLKEELSR